ncbi:MAG: YlxR family protein [Candidatus Atribacteria bacterium]|nr:YlxR family protein [Candidatus Atribacteria bacterium]
MKSYPKIPYRTCIGCQEKKPKKELLRIIRTPEGIIEIDETGKKSGRGAYLCYNIACWQEAVKKKRLGKALKVELTREIIETLEEKFKTIEKE